MRHNQHVYDAQPWGLFEIAFVLLLAPSPCHAIYAFLTMTRSEEAVAFLAHTNDVSAMADAMLPQEIGQCLDESSEQCAAFTQLDEHTACTIYNTVACFMQNIAPFTQCIMERVAPFSQPRALCIIACCHSHSRVLDMELSAVWMVRFVA
jgi:hypothetical protein